MYGLSTLCKHGWKILRTIPLGLSNPRHVWWPKGFSQSLAKAAKKIGTWKVLRKHHQDPEQTVSHLFGEPYKWTYHPQFGFHVGFFNWAGLELDTTNSSVKLLCPKNEVCTETVTLSRENGAFSRTRSCFNDTHWIPLVFWNSYGKAPFSLNHRTK